MFSRNLKYYRLKNNLTKKELASRVGISLMSITHYENGDRYPEMSIIKKLAETLDVKVVDFLASRNEHLEFYHGEFRKNSRMAKSKQSYIREAVEEYFSRFFDAVEILGGEVLPETPPVHSIPLEDDIEVNGKKLRTYLGIPETGPIGELIERLENKGFLIFLMESDEQTFSGMNGTVNGRPYIVINRKMTPERIRTTIGHELAHIAFIWPEDMSEKNAEKIATAIAGAFLIPEEDVIRELGIRRRALTTDMYMVCEEYGIAMSLLTVRAYLCNVINEKVYRDFFISLNNSPGGRKNEPSRIAEEKTNLFEQLVYRAVNEEEISIQRGAELLNSSYEAVASNCACIGG